MTDKKIQEDKEKAVLLALQKDMALIRRGLEIHGMKKDGSTIFISNSDNHDKMWEDALNKLQKE